MWGADIIGGGYFRLMTRAMSPRGSGHVTTWFVVTIITYIYIRLGGKEEGGRTRRERVGREEGEGGRRRGKGCALQ